MTQRTREEILREQRNSEGSYRLHTDLHLALLTEVLLDIRDTLQELKNKQ